MSHISCFEGLKKKLSKSDIEIFNWNFEKACNAMQVNVATLMFLNIGKTGRHLASYNELMTKITAGREDFCSRKQGTVIPVYLFIREKSRNWTSHFLLS